MDPDLYLVIGLCLGCLAVPSMIAAFSEGRAPRAAFVVGLIAAGLVGTALYTNGGYSFAETMHAVYTVIGRYLL